METDSPLDTLRGLVRLLHEHVVTVCGEAAAARQVVSQLADRAREAIGAGLEGDPEALARAIDASLADLLSQIDHAEACKTARLEEELVVVDAEIEACEKVGPAADLGSSKLFARAVELPLLRAVPVSSVRLATICAPRGLRASDLYLRASPSLNNSSFELDLALDDAYECRAPGEADAALDAVVAHVRVQAHLEIARSADKVSLSSSVTHDKHRCCVCVSLRVPDGTSPGAVVVVTGAWVGGNAISPRLGVGLELPACFPVFPEAPVLLRSHFIRLGCWTVARAVPEDPGDGQTEALLLWNDALQGCNTWAAVELGDTNGWFVFERGTDRFTQWSSGNATNEHDSMYAPWSRARPSLNVSVGAFADILRAPKALPDGVLLVGVADGMHIGSASVDALLDATSFCFTVCILDGCPCTFYSDGRLDIGSDRLGTDAEVAAARAAYAGKAPQSP